MSRNKDRFSLDQIYEYDNYRRFLRDFFNFMKEQKRKFSYRFFAQRAGFSSHSFCEFVIKGQRNLTIESTLKMAKGLGLNKKGQKYFQNLVMYNQARTVQEREEYLKEIQRIRKSIKFYKITEQQYVYYSEWYYPVVRELAVYSDWNGNYKEMARMITPPITPEMARNAVQLLVEHGFLIKLAGGKFMQSDSIVTGPKGPSYLFNKAKKEFMLRGMEALENLNRDERHIAISTVAMSRKTFKEIGLLLAEVRKKILVSASEDNVVDQIYALNINLFPLTKKIRRGKKTGGGLK